MTLARLSAGVVMSTSTHGLLQEIRATLQQGRILGTERFKDTIQTILARRVRPGKAGRPRQAPSAQRISNSTDTCEHASARMARAKEGTRRWR